MGALVVLAPSTQEWIDCFNQLLGRHGHTTFGPLPHLILKAANRFLSRIRIQRTRTRVATDLTHGKSKSLPALDLVAEELEAMLNVDDPRLRRMQLHSQLSQDSQGDGHCRSRLCRRLTGNHPVSSPRESHPEALAELYVSLSTHTAPVMEPRRTPICQQANSAGARREIRAIQCVALRRWPRSFLYFRLAHKARSRSSWRIVG